MVQTSAVSAPRDAALGLGGAPAHLVTLSLSYAPALARAISLQPAPAAPPSQPPNCAPEALSFLRPLASWRTWRNTLQRPALPGRTIPCRPCMPRRPPPETRNVPPRDS